jgi:CheY-like chemotaxis protein
MPGEDQLPPRVILVVEDDFLIRDTIAEELRRIGWTVIEAESGEEALDLIAANPDIDFLFTDINLKGELTGWDVAEAFRSHRPKQGVIYTSGIVQDRARVVSSSAYLTKPYEPVEVLTACQSLLVE